VKTTMMLDVRLLKLYHNVTDRQIERQTDRQGSRWHRCIPSHKIWLSTVYLWLEIFYAFISYYSTAANIHNDYNVSTLISPRSVVIFQGKIVVVFL